MAYPDPSDFRSGEPLAAWFLIGAGEGRTLGVATQGFTANRRIQRALNEYGAGRELVFGARLTEDGIIGANTLARLRTAALEHAREDAQGGYASIAERLAADIRNRTISPLSYRWGLWLAYVRRNPELVGRAWESVVVTANTTLPAFNVAPDDDRAAGGQNLQAVTWLDGVQSPPQPQARSGTSTPVGSVAPTPGTPQPQTTGATPQTVTAGRDVPQPGSASSSALATTGTPSVTAPVAAMESRVGGVPVKWWLLGAGAVAVVALAASSGGRSGARSGRRAARSTTVVYRYGSGRKRAGRR